MHKFLLLCLLSIMLLPGQALAAKYLTALYSTPSGDEIRIVVKDAQTLRVEYLEEDRPIGEYCLVNKDGSWHVEVLEPDEPFTEAIITAYILEDNLAPVIKTDRKVTISGIKGLVWEIQGKELVVTANKDIVLITNALKRFINFYGFSRGPAPFIDSLNTAEQKEYGLLKYEDYKLTSLEKVEYPKDFFELP